MLHRNVQVGSKCASAFDSKETNICKKINQKNETYQKILEIKIFYGNE